MKKAVSLLLALVIVLGLSSVAFAAGSGKITGVKESLDYRDTSKIDWDEVTPGTIVYFPLYGDAFTWTTGTGDKNQAVTASQLKNTLAIKTSKVDSKIIKDISFVNKPKGYSTAALKVEFVDEWVSTSSKDFEFTVYLTVNKVRSKDSEITLSGTFQNNVLDADSGDEYISLEDYPVVEPSEAIRNAELDFGNDVIVTMNLTRGKKYYGSSTTDLSAADEKMYEKYDDLVEIITLKQINIKPSGKVVEIDKGQSYYVYDSDGKYLGTTDSKVAFSEKYYLTDKKYDSLSSSGSSSSNSSSSKDDSSGDDVAPQPSTPSGSTGTTTTSGAVSTATAKSLAQSAVSTAKSSGSATATARVKDTSSISAEALKAMAAEGTSSIKVKLNADTMNGTSVAGRLSIDTSAASNLTGDIKLGVFTDNAHTGTTQGKFDKWFKNNCKVINLEQSGSYGMTVTVAVKVNLSSLNTNNLVIYSYDKSTNKYTQLTNTGYKVDSSGYLHFNTNVGGDIIVTDSALVLA